MSEPRGLLETEGFLRAVCIQNYDPVTTLCTVAYQFPGTSFAEAWRVEHVPLSALRGINREAALSFHLEHEFVYEDRTRIAN